MQAARISTRKRRRQKGSRGRTCRHLLKAARPVVQGKGSTTRAGKSGGFGRRRRASTLPPRCRRSPRLVQAALGRATAEHLSAFTARARARRDFFRRQQFSPQQPVSRRGVRGAVDAHPVSPPPPGIPPDHAAPPCFLFARIAIAHERLYVYGRARVRARGCRVHTCAVRVYITRAAQAPDNEPYLGDRTRRAGRGRAA